MLGKILSSVGNFAIKHGPEITTGLAIAGSVQTAFLASKATVKALRIVDEEEIANGFEPDVKQRWVGRAKMVWRLYIPTAVSGTFTIAMIICSNHLLNKRAAIISASLATVQSYADRYFEATKETLDETTFTKVQEKFSEKVGGSLPLEGNLLVEDAGGDQLFLETVTGRYFLSTLPAVKDAIANAKYALYNDSYISLNELSTYLGIPHTASGDFLGWVAPGGFDVTIDATINRNNHSVIVINYLNHPKVISSTWDL